MTIKLSILIILLCCFSYTQASEKITHRYTVIIHSDMRGLSVHACFPDSQPEKLINYSDSKNNYLEHVYITNNRHHKTTLKSLQNTIPLPALTQSDCVNYNINFYGDSKHSRFNKRIENSNQLLLNLHSWLWFPDNVDNQKHALDIEFNLPIGINISAPWPIVNQKTINNRQLTTFRHSNRPAYWDGKIAIGKFKTLGIQKGSTLINVAILNAAQAFDASRLQHWIDKNLDALLLTYGDFPVSNLQLLIIPVGKDHEPVPWGEAMHGGGDSIHLYIDQTRPLTEFMNDWVLIHELSHLLHPRFSNATWLSEGIASYYQNVLRSRSGLLDEQKAWQKLHEGFQRGIRGTPTDKTLAQVSATMMRSQSFMRVYWSGAAISLLADYELRKLSNNKQSLDTAMKSLSQCCLKMTKTWSRAEIIEKLDSLTHTQVFSQLNKQYLHSTKFPQLEAVYSKLGLTVHENKIKINSQAKDAFIRKAIMGERY